MSQFRKTGAIYVSQWNGDNVNAGTDPTLPKKTIAGIGTTAQNNVRAIIGAGHYKTVFVGSKQLIADGKVVYDLLGANIPAGGFYEGIHFKNFANLGTNSVQENSHIDCIYESSLNPAICIRRDALSSAFHHGRNLFLTNWRPQGNGGWRNENSIFIGKMNTVLTIGFAIFKYNYVDKASEINLNITTEPTAINNNCINGDIRVLNNATLYESKKLIDGSTRPDADPLKPDIVDVFPNFYAQGNFSCLSTDVKFIDLISRTVESDSILLQRSNTNGYIGGVKVGKKIDLDESGFTITKTGIDDSNPNFWKIATGINFAKIRITGKVSDSLISAQTLDIRIPFNFDGDVAGNTANNNNVPDAWNDRTTPDTKGTQPNRLTFEVRSSTLANPSRDVSADWDNDNTNNPSIAGRYYLMEYGQPMLHHVISSVVYGNADANAINAATKLPFNYRSLDIIITITNTRTI